MTSVEVTAPLRKRGYIAFFIQDERCTIFAVKNSMELVKIV